MSARNTTACPLSEDDLTDIAGHIYYEYGDGNDNTFGTYFTDFVWSFQLLMVVILFSLRYQHNNQDHSFLLYMISIGFLVVAIFCGGIWHAVCANPDSKCYSPMWNFAMAMQTICGAFTCMAAFALITKNDAQVKNYVFYAISGSIGMCFSIYSFFVVMSFALAALIGNFGPNVFLLVAILMKPFKYYSAMYLFGFLLLVIGIIIQATGASDCSTDCPEDCPYDVPNINHNGVFHIFCILAYILMPLGFYLLYTDVISYRTIKPKDPV